MSHLTLKSVFACLSLCGLVVAEQVVLTTAACKCVPSELCWPSEADFQVLNQTVDGNLIQGVPPGSVCYKDQPNYDDTKCQYVLENWHVSTFHATNPISVGWPQWAGNPCPPIYSNGTSVNGDPNAGSKGCRLGGYPDYALNATNASHVADVVCFARKHNIRLNVKSTGHSFTGRSTSFGSISVWTHYLQGIEYIENFQPDACNAYNQSASMAFRVAAGSRVRDVYEAANAQNAIVVGGSAQDVGIVGWFTGGGHGPLSSTYGMGVDNVLEATVVTPDGNVVTANECQHPDLFWAIRGGGGGTFGVITEVVLRGYPAPTSENLVFSLGAIDAANLTAFWDAVEFFVSEVPRLKAGGLSGYSFILPAGYIPELGWAIAGEYRIFNQPNGTSGELIDPIIQYVNERADQITFNWFTTYFPSFFADWNSSIGFEAVATGSAVLGSRLLTAETLIKNKHQVRTVIQNLTENQPFPQPLCFYPVTNTVNRDLNVSLTPAWRNAVVHTIATLAFPDNVTLDQGRQAYDYMTDVIAPQLKSLDPDSGAYINEGDPNDPNWQYTFFGENYPRLLAVKQRYDPDGVLWCRSCVGSEDWVPHDRYGDGNGEGQLCRTPWI